MILIVLALSFVGILYSVWVGRYEYTLGIALLAFSYTLLWKPRA